MGRYAISIVFGVVITLSLLFVMQLLIVTGKQALTEPRGASTRALSAIDEPVTTRSPMMTGGDVIWNSPGHISSMPTSSLT